jgi:hypothetical protein
VRPGARPPPLTVSRPHPRAAHRHLLVCAPQDILGEVHERRDGIKEWIGTSKDVLTALKDIVIPEEGVSLSKLYSMCKKSKGDGAWAGSIKLLSQGAGAAIADEVQIQDGEEPSAARDRVQVKVTADKRRSKMLQALYPLLVGMLGRLQNGKRQIDEAIDFVLMLLPIVATEANKEEAAALAGKVAVDHLGTIVDLSIQNTQLQASLDELRSQAAADEEAAAADQAAAEQAKVAADNRLTAIRRRRQALAEVSPSDAQA